MGDNDTPGTPWVASDGTIAHPDSPSGGSGPGYSAIQEPLGTDGFDSGPPHPLSPDGRYAVPPGAEQLDTGVKEINPPNAPPTTAATKFTMKKVKDARNDINLEGEVLADGADANLGMGAETRLNPKDKVTYSFPEYETTDTPPFKVLEEKGTFTLKGQVTIKVFYSPNGSAKETARYGRGTTDDDKKNKNTTSGFHESCHVADYTSWLKNKSIPIFTGKVGMSKKDYEDACTKWEKDWDKYFADAEADSEKKTDEVGYTKTQYETDHPKKP